MQGSADIIPYRVMNVVLREPGVEKQLWEDWKIMLFSVRLQWGLPDREKCDYSYIVERNNKFPEPKLNSWLSGNLGKRAVTNSPIINGLLFGNKTQATGFYPTTVKK